MDEISQLAELGQWQPTDRTPRPPCTEAGLGFGLSEPIILDAKLADKAAEILLWVDPALPYFEGHFPGQPILPAVTQIQWLTALAERCYPKHTQSGCLGLTNCKFVKPVEPCAVITATLQLELGEDRGKITHAKVVGTFSIANVQHARGTLKYRG